MFSRFKLLTTVAAAGAISLLVQLTLWSAQAQELNCTNPSSQAEMTGCASRAHDEADAELNKAYKEAIKAAGRQDEYLIGDQIPSKTMLRDAQRAWVTFRDQACETESTLARGGTLQNQIFYECLTRLTNTRTADLKLFSQGLN